MIRARVTRWHADFDLDNLPDVEKGHIPQPPNTDKYSSAKDILSTCQDRDATKYSRLPEIARLLHNIYVTERKWALKLNFVLDKLENSYRSTLTASDMEAHLKLIGKECPEWELSFIEIGKTMYLKIKKDDGKMQKIIDKLKDVANEKCK